MKSLLEIYEDVVNEATQFKPGDIVWYTDNDGESHEVKIIRKSAGKMKDTYDIEAYGSRSKLRSREISGVHANELELDENTISEIMLPKRDKLPEDLKELAEWMQREKDMNNSVIDSIIHKLLKDGWKKK